MHLDATHTGVYENLNVKKDLLMEERESGIEKHWNHYCKNNELSATAYEVISVEFK